MTIVEINSFNCGSTGKIMMGISEKAQRSGYRVVTCCPKCTDNTEKKFENQIIFGSKTLRHVHLFLAKLTGLNGCFSIYDTVKLIKKLKKYDVELIHLHNLHNCYINLPILFSYIKKNKIPVVWTLHDCWSFTGHCTHFTISKCMKWKNGCYACECYKEYPYSYVDRSSFMWKRKQGWFSDIENMTIVTPSKWLQDLVSMSFLKSYDSRVINNGIDLSVFKPIRSNFRKRYHCENKFIVLGVAFGWGYKKGLDVFCELSKRLPKCYQIVLVGTNDAIDTELPCNIISIHRTNNQRELAEIYSASDVFFNPTRQENFPTVNMEALACGTPVVTYNTGGAAEMLDDKTGVVVSGTSIEENILAIVDVCEKHKIERQDCIEHSKIFDMHAKYQEYIDIYKEKEKD